MWRICIVIPFIKYYWCPLHNVFFIFFFFLLFIWFEIIFKRNNYKKNKFSIFDPFFIFHFHSKILRNFGFSLLLMRKIKLDENIFLFSYIINVNFNFYINFGPHFYNCYLLFPYYFFIEIFYLSNLVLILLIVTFFFEIIYEMLIIIILIYLSFIFFIF